MRSRHGFKHTHRLASWLVAMSIATIACGLIAIYGAWRYPLPDPEADWRAIHVLVGLASLGYGVGLVTGIVLGLTWTFRVAWNARHMGALGFDVSPAMSVGWYFVPFANLVKPYQAMRQVYWASLDPSGWRDVGQPLVASWWVLFIGSGLLARMSSAVDPALDAPINWLDLAAITAQAAAAIAFIVMVRRIGSAQSAPTHREKSAHAAAIPT